MSEFGSVLDALAAVDVDGLTGAQVLDLVAEVSAGINRLQATLCRVVRSAEAGQAHAGDGARSMKAWLRGTCHLSPSDAAAVLCTARRLSSLPAVGEVFAPGAITAAHARVICAALSPRRLAQAGALGVDAGRRPGRPGPRRAGRRQPAGDTR